MTSIDELFKRPTAPLQKRKLEPTRDPNELYKSTKLSGSTHARSNAQPMVEDDPEEDDDAVAGPEMPPEMEDGENDEEGRFFGGGINADTADVLDFIHERDQEITAKPEKIDSAWVRKLALNFERRITKNAELRAKYEGDPQKFMGSEADLDADIKALSILTENTELYKEFAELGCVASLVSLLSHENTDIAIDAIEIIGELIDEDVEAEQSQWDALVDAMLEADVLDLLHQNISRLDENVESDRNGVYYILGVFDDLTSRPSIADLIGGHPSIIPYLLSRAQNPEKPVSQNKQYAAEVLAILLQISTSNCDRFLEQDGMDKFLQLLAAYRKRDPEKGTDEEEYVENVFGCVTCCLDKPIGKEKFLEAEGVELCLIMLREGKFCRPRALRLLDHALDGLDGGPCCEKLVEAAGLRVLFTLFMKKQDHSSTEHILDILAHMLRSLPADSAQRIRLLGKFVEKNYEKIDRLSQLRREYSSRLASTDGEIAEEKNGLEAEELEERAEEWSSRRLESGLFSLQVTDTILAWLVAEDDGAKRHIRRGLAERDEGLESIKGTLQEQVEGMDGEAGGMRDMLETLMAFL